MSTTAETVAKFSQPYKRLKDLVEIAVEEQKPGGISKYDIMSVCILESMGTSIFCACDALFKSEIETVMALTGVSRSEFLKAIKIIKGANKNGLAKFFFSKEWFEKIKADEKLKDLAPAMKALFSCSIGITQQHVQKLMDGLDLEPPYDYLETFKADEEMQIRSLYFLLDKHLVKNEGDKVRAFTTYHLEQSARKDRNFGLRAKDLADKLEKVYTP